MPCWNTWQLPCRRVSPFVFLALAIAVFTAGMLIVVVRELLRNVRGLTGQVRTSTQRLVPLTDELQSELAVTSLEVEGLTKSVERVAQERAGRAKRRKPRRQA